MSNIKEMTELKQLIISWLINHDVAENKLTSILTILSHGVALKDDYVYKVKVDEIQIPIQPSDHIDSPMKMDAAIRNTKAAKDIVEGLRGIKSETYTFDHELNISPPHHLTRKEGESPIPLQRLAELFNHRPNGGL